MLAIALLGLAAALAALPPAAAQAPPARPAATAAPVYRVPVTGTIEMGLAPFIERALQEAEAAGARAVILDIDTPGGRVDAAERIADALRDAKVPTYAYVNRRAFSAGALIALATDGIYMRPGSSLGAATPVTGDGKKAPEKMVSAMRAEFRALAEERGLDPRYAEAMVDEEVEIAGFKPKGKLLTLSTQEAVRIGFAREIADYGALLATLGHGGAPMVEMRTNWAESLVRFFTHPVVAPLLLSLGFLGLIVEMRTPAFGLAGLAGAASLGLFFGSHLLLGLAGWEVLLLLLGGIVLLLAEFFVLPGFGVAGVLGLLAVGASIVLSMLGSMPSQQDVLTALLVVAATLVLTAVMLWQLLRRLPLDRRGPARRLIFRGALRSDAGYVAAPARAELIGVEGVALTDLRPAGVAQVGEERLDVVSEGGFVAAGARVRVVAAEGYRQVVHAV